MSAGFKLAETTIFIPEPALKAVTDEFTEAGFTVLPHPFSATHHNLKEGIAVSGQMVDVLGPFPLLARTVASILATYGLEGSNNPVFVFPFE